MKSRLVKREREIVRILKSEDNRCFVIDCVNRGMPRWISKAELTGFVDCTEEELYKITGISKDRVLNMEELKIARERFTMIAPILAFMVDERKRSHMINVVSQDVSKQTIRRYLCRYLIYQNIEVLAPAEKVKRELTKEEKDIRWGINKFYLNRDKNSLKTAYTLMLKERYCDENGQLLEQYPSFHQFRYYYRTHLKERQKVIMREGINSYERDHRPILGTVQEYAGHLGVGFLDSTVCDIYIVDDTGNPSSVRRPVLTVCIDGYSSMCLGYSITWQGGVSALRSLMENIVTDKVDWCKQHGVLINKKDWNTTKFPSTLVTDKGREYACDTFSQVVDLGIKLINLPPYHPQLKGPVEKFFHLIQQEFKKFLKGHGVIEMDYQERGRNYKREAHLDRKMFEQILLRAIVYYNSKRIVENHPYSSDMIGNIKPFANEIFEYGLHQPGANMLNITADEFKQVLLPRRNGKFTRKGLKVNGLRYKNPYYVEEYLNGRGVVVAYDPEDVSKVWLIEKGNFVLFELIETRFEGKTIDEVQEMKKQQNEWLRSVTHENLQARVELAEHIQSIANIPKHNNATKQKNEQNQTKAGGEKR